MKPWTDLLGSLWPCLGQYSVTERLSHALRGRGRAQTEARGRPGLAATSILGKAQVTWAACGERRAQVECAGATGPALPRGRRAAWGCGCDCVALRGRGNWGFRDRCCCGGSPPPRSALLGLLLRWGSSRPVLRDYNWRSRVWMGVKGHTSGALGSISFHQESNAISHPVCIFPESHIQNEGENIWSTLRGLTVLGCWHIY